MHVRGELKLVEIGGYKMFLIALLIVEILGVASAGQISENTGSMYAFLPLRMYEVAKSSYDKRGESL